MQFSFAFCPVESGYDYAPVVALTVRLRITHRSGWSSTFAGSLLCALLPFLFDVPFRRLRSGTGNAKTDQTTNPCRMRSRGADDLGGECRVSLIVDICR